MYQLEEMTTFGRQLSYRTSNLLNARRMAAAVLNNDPTVSRVFIMKAAGELAEEWHRYKGRAERVGSRPVQTGLF